MVRVTAERAALAILGGTCVTPVAVLATLEGADIAVRGQIALPDGSKFRRIAGPGPGGRGRAAGRDGGRGAAPARAPGVLRIVTRALVTRPAEDSAALADALRARGIEPLVDPMLRIEPVEDAHLPLDGVQAVLFTSANGVRAFAQAHGAARPSGLRGRRRDRRRGARRRASPT